MGSATIALCLFALAFVISTVESVGFESCPQPSKVYGCSPKCQQDYECSHGKICCRNSCNAKSCTEKGSGGSAGGDKYSQTGGTGIYCGNVKCSSFEKCIIDPATKRQKCGRV